MSPAIMAATMVPPASIATPARHSLRPLWLAKPTRLSSGACAWNRAEEIRRRCSSLAMRARTFSAETSMFSVAVSRSIPASRQAATRVAANSW